MKTLSILTTVSILAIGLTGCGSSNNTKNVSYGHITGHLTPELKGLSERPSDDKTAFKVASNSNWRMFWDDLGRAFLLDTPSRMSPMPVVNTSGQLR